MGDVEVKAVVMTMPHSLAEAQAKTPGHNLQDVETDASAKTLAETLPELKSEKVSMTLTDARIASKV